MMSFPTRLTAGNLLAWQATLEAKLEAVLSRHTKQALTQIRNDALAFSLTPASARVAWEHAVFSTLVELGLDSDTTLFEDLRDEALGDEAYSSAMSVMALRSGTFDSVSPEDLQEALDEVLALDTPSLLAAGGPRWVSSLLSRFKRLGPPWRTKVKRAVRTSFTGLTGRLTLAEMERRGVVQKKWVTRRDPKVRETHAEADGQTAPLHSHFTVGGVSLLYPGERHKPLKETANCRCVIIPA